MANFYTLSPNGVPENPHLFPTMRPTFIARGHSFVGRIEDADCVLLDLHSRIADYNVGDVSYIVNNCPPVVTFDEWDRGNMSSDIWPAPLTQQQLRIWQVIKTKSVHFCRLFTKTHEIPSNLYPYEKPIIYEEPLHSKEDLFNRPIDIFFVANSSPNREKIKEVFEKDGRFKCNIVLGQPKIPFHEWLSQCRQAKFFIKASAGGYSCERLQALFSISPMLLERTDQLLAHPFTDLENCITFGNPLNKTDLDVIYEVLNDKERLYEIYNNGYDFVKKHYSSEAWGDYYLSILKQEGVL